MNLIVLGANGRTGALVLKTALSEGFHVTAVVRSEAKRPALEHDHLTHVVGDCCDPQFLKGVFAHHDAVISTLGGRSPSKGATCIYWRSADAIGEAAVAVGLKQVAVTSSALLFPPQRWIDRLLAALVRNVVQSATRMEATLRNADLDVVVARCGFLTNQEEEKYRSALDVLPENGSSVSRHGLAHFLVDTVRDPQPGFRVYGVSGPA